MQTGDYYGQLAMAMQTIKADLRDLLQDLRASGKHIATARRPKATLLGYCDLGNDLIEHVVNRSEHKQGRYLPGPRLSFRAPSSLLETQPDYVVLLVCNIAAEVLAQQHEYRPRGGRFIIPIPRVRFLTEDDDL